MDHLWIWLVVELSTPLKNMSSSIGMMTFPSHMEKKNVPNHQPVEYVPADRESSGSSLFSY